MGKFGSNAAYNGLGGGGVSQGYPTLHHGCGHRRDDGAFWRHHVQIRGLHSDKYPACGFEKQVNVALMEDEIDADTKNMLQILKVILANMLGPMGQNMHFLLFPGKTDSGSRIASAKDKGQFSVKLGQKEFKWRPPLRSTGEVERDDHEPADLADLADLAELHQGRGQEHGDGGGGREQLAGLDHLRPRPRQGRLIGHRSRSRSGRAVRDENLGQFSGRKPVGFSGSRC